jgi:uncharacterized protein with PQ loop repeat
MISNIIGYIGAFFLACRYAPVMLLILRGKANNINLKFLGLEVLASGFLGASAIIIGSFPFIICNAISGLCALIIMVVQVRNGKNESKQQSNSAVHDLDPNGTT